MKSSTAVVPIDTLGATIKAHIAKGDGAMDKAEQHYKAAGIHLMEAKERVRTTPGLTWPAFLNMHCAIRRRRADELIAIADGRTTVEDLRRQKRESVRATRERQKPVPALRSAQATVVIAGPQVPLASIGATDGNVATDPEPMSPAWLWDRYLDAGLSLLDSNPAAREAFLSRPLSHAEIVRALQGAGERAAVKLLEGML